MCAIQRFIILHLGLLPTQGFYDGDASNEELCEHILYYNELLGEGQIYPLVERCCYNSEAAAKFAGLCTAFYSIQSTIDSQLLNPENGHDSPVDGSRTQEVYLSMGTLVFIPLENLGGTEIVAVAQLQRFSSRTSGRTEMKNEKELTATETIRKNIQSAHELFVLMNHGGIRPRLNNLGIIQRGVQARCEDREHTEQYPLGMSDFYALKRQLREQRAKARNAQDADEMTRIHDNILQLEKQVAKVDSEMPLRELRTDLKFYYDSYLRDDAATS